MLEAHTVQISFQNTYAATQKNVKRHAFEIWETQNTILESTFTSASSVIHY